MHSHNHGFGGHHHGFFRPVGNGCPLNPLAVAEGMALGAALRPPVLYPQSYVTPAPIVIQQPPQVYIQPQPTPVYIQQPAPVPAYTQQPAATVCVSQQGMFTPQQPPQQPVTIQQPQQTPAYYPR